MSASDPAALSIDQRQAIWDAWQTRITMQSLADNYGTTQEVIRHIISRPRPT